MNGITKSKSTKLLSALLAVLMIVAMLPTTAFAWSVEEGTKCTSTYGDHYVGSDGEMFYSKPTTTAIFYNDDGSFYVKTYSSGNAKYKYMMIDGNGNQHHVYCIEGGVSFDYSDTYNSTSGKNSKYFQNLPITAQYGIMMALMYGYHEGMTSPIPGTNNDDFAFATQCIIWEYQQQLRTSPTSIASNNGIDADMYNHTIKGRPAEQCYNWILEQMSKHYVVPSFASRNQSNAQTYTMKYDQANDNYSITLTDTNNTLCNQKGGVGKTTTTVNLGVGLAMQGKKVLLIDADPQGDLTTCLGWQDTDNLGITLATKLTDVINETMNDPTGGILHHDEGVDLVPANLELSAMEFNLVNAMSRETALRNYLSEVKDKYDYILIDCMPSLGMVTINALSAADSVIIPVQAQYLPAKGMTQLVQTISRVKKRINPNLKIDGMLLTLVDSRTNLAKSTVEALRENFGSQIKMYRTYIPIAVKAAETSSKGKSIFAYEPGSTVSKAYTEFTKEVLADGRKKERLHSHEAR